MRLVTACLAVVVVGLAAWPLLAQQPATTVQLPTFSYFGISTSVLVPDRGSAYMGGVGRAASSSQQFGAPLLPFGNRSTGSSMGGTSARVSVTIHDFEAMDEALLSQSAYYNAYRSELPARTPDAWQQRLAASQGSPAGQAAPSVEDVRAQRQAAQEMRAGEAVVFFERARKAEESGKMGVAKIYYQMVARRATGELKDKALARLEAMRGAKSDVVASGP